MATRNRSVAVAALSVDLGGALPLEFRLLPAGEFRASRDGRPFDVSAWRMDAAIAARVIARIRARQDDLVIDYEHQTMNAEHNGQPAPAAGWISPAGVVWRDDGLYATDLRWTERARTLIAGDEYRYVSPVFTYDTRTGEVLDVLMVGITNYPGIDGLTELTNRAAARFSFDDMQEGNPVNEELLKLLGLAKDATEEQIKAAIVALKSGVDAVQGELEAARTALAAAKAETGTVDPAKYVPIAAVGELQAQVAALRGQVDGREIDELVRSALDEGRLVPAMEGWARDLGKKDIAALRTYIDAAAPIAALKSTQTGGQGPRDKNGALSDVQMAVCRQMGISPGDYEKALAEQAAS